MAGVKEPDGVLGKLIPAVHFRTHLHIKPFIVAIHFVVSSYQAEPLIDVRLHTRWNVEFFWPDITSGPEGPQHKFRPIGKAFLLEESEGSLADGFQMSRFIERELLQRLDERW